jgi:hypothetical protein
MFEVLKIKLHGPLKSSSSILQAKRNFSIRKCTQKTNKNHFMLVLRLDLNFIILGKTIHEIKYLATRIFIDDLVNKRGWKIDFQASFVQVTEFHTYADHALLLVDRNRIQYPFCQLHKVDETIFEEFLYFILYRCCFMRID